MKNLFWIFVLLFSISLFPQNDYLKTKALTFSFNGLNLNQFYGGIGGKAWLCDDLALNANISFDGRTSTMLGNETRTEGSDKTKAIIFGIGVEKHFSVLKDISPYWEGRISGNYSESKYKSTRNINDPPFSGSSYSRRISIETGFGVEYWLTEKISFSGQHLFSFHYGTGSNQSTSTVNNQKIIERGFDTGTSSLILSIYF